MKNFILSLTLILNFAVAYSQLKPADNPRPITIEEYNKAKSFTIQDMDKQTYVKFENTYILDRYEMRKPYFITGDDGLKKRIDLYKLIAKDGMQELATVIFYTSEKGKLFTAVQPNFTADAAIWNQYFEDIHSIDKEEKNFVLKLSYVLSKEMSFQLYKAINKGKDLKAESATYGAEICFPGDQEIAMADGSVKHLSQINPGDIIVSVDPVTTKTKTVTVSKVVQHEEKNYAITRIIAMASIEKKIDNGIEVLLSTRILSATPNHPVATTNAVKAMSKVEIGDQLFAKDEKTNRMLTFTVIDKTEKAGGFQKVYSIEASGNDALLLNGIMVMQK